MSKKFNIYTAIAYTSGKPHIGNTYEIVLADAIARYKRLSDYDVYFQTGTDEHGEKIETKAKDEGISPQEYVDEVALEIRRIWDVMNTSYDKFVRTTNPIHKDKVTKIFKRLYEQGDIYKGEYIGKYCTPCESFFTESQLVNGLCPDCGREVYETKEEAYFLKLSKYEERLKNYIESNIDFILPISRKNEIMNNFINKGLDDLCVSRTSFKWGIPVDFDNNHIVYVWIDALSNYITFLGYDVNNNHSEEFYNNWPADVHIIGKDILRFHAIYWIVMLMALEIDLPKQIFAHPWVLSSDDKMSKSKGNLVYADDLVKEFGVDAVRFYFLSQIPYANDGIFTYELLIDKINAELANNLGNLVHRTITMAHKYFSGVVEEPENLEKLDKEFQEFIISINTKVENKINEYKIAEAINSVMEIFDRANKYIDETTPWILANEEKHTQLKTVIYNLLEAIRHGAVLLQPFLPETAEKIFHQLNTSNKYFESLNSFDGLDYGIKLNEPTPIFIRVDKKLKLEEILK